MSTKRSIWLSILTVFALAGPASATAPVPAEPGNAAHFCEVFADFGAWASMNSQSIGAMASDDYSDRCQGAVGSSTLSTCTLADSHLATFAPWSALNAHAIGEMATTDQAAGCMIDGDSDGTGVCTQPSSHLANYPPTNLAEAQANDVAAKAFQASNCDG